MTEEIIREYTVGRFRGDFPDVDIAPGVDMEALKELDAAPFFATLPIVPEVGAISENGLLYDEELVSSIEKQINENKPGGIFGHLKDEERNTSYPLPSGMWVGAKRIANTLWGKVYCPPGAGREHIRTLKALGGEIATSIYGKGKFEKVRDGVRRLTNFKLESLDFAPPTRAALGYGAIPYVTSEMNMETTMADKQAVIQELRDATVPPQRGWTPSDTATVSEMTSQLAARDDRITVLETTVQEFQRREFERAVDEKVAEMTDWPVGETAPDANGKTGKDKLAALRAMFRRAILEKMADDHTVEGIAEITAEAWEGIRPIAEIVRDALAGPAAVVNGRVQATGAVKSLVDTPEARNAAMASMGINI